MLTIAEVPEYIRRAEKLLTETGRREILDYLAANPKAGEIMEGKSGGVRVIYYFHSDLMPLYLLTVFAKNERANLTRAERNELAGLVDMLVAAWLDR